MPRRERTVGAVSRPSVWRADGKRRTECRRGENNVEEDSVCHAATGKLAGAACWRPAGRMACGKLKLGAACPPPARRPDGRRPTESWQCQDTVGGASGWHVANTMSAQRAHRWRGVRMERAGKACLPVWCADETQQPRNQWGGNAAIAARGAHAVSGMSAVHRCRAERLTLCDRKISAEGTLPSWRAEDTG
jgi:hypothetical protein